MTSLETSKISNHETQSKTNGRRPLVPLAALPASLVAAAPSPPPRAPGLGGVHGNESPKRTGIPSQRWRVSRSPSQSFRTARSTRLGGWGYGFSGTLGWMTGTLGFPTAAAAVAILTEIVAPVALVVGAASRLAALGVIGIMLGAISTHVSNGFFMNWFGGLPAGQEGFEYHLLVMVLSTIVLIAGGGVLSLDRWLARKFISARALVLNTESPVPVPPEGWGCERGPEEQRGPCATSQAESPWAGLQKVAIPLVRRRTVSVHENPSGPSRLTTS